MAITANAPRSLAGERPWVAAGGLASAWSGVAIMWLFWFCFVIFLLQPPAMMSWWPLPTVDRGGWLVSTAARLLIDIGLIALFGLQHSVMARPRFKAWLSPELSPNLGDGLKDQAAALG